MTTSTGEIEVPTGADLDRASETVEVDESNARRYSDVDEEAGFVPPCVARPRSDCRLRALQYDEMLDHRAAHGLSPGRSKR